VARDRVAYQVEAQRPSLNACFCPDDYWQCWGALMLQKRKREAHDPLEGDNDALSKPIP
jgi:hypothetical protein